MWKWSTRNAHWPGQTKRWTRVACHAASGLANQRPGNEQRWRTCHGMFAVMQTHGGVARNYGGKTVTVTAPLRATGIRVRPRVTVATLVLSIASGVWYVSQCAATGVERSLALPNAPACERFPLGCTSHGDQAIFCHDWFTAPLCKYYVSRIRDRMIDEKLVLFVTSERMYKCSVIAELQVRDYCYML